MRIYLIALVESSQGLMCRLIDADNPTDLKLYPEKAVVFALSNGKIQLENAKAEGGQLVGTNGVIDRYPRIGIDGKLKNKPSMVIFNQIGDRGYTVCDYNGNVKKFSTADAVKYAKSFDIANGKLVSRDNIEFISSISGKYEVVDIPRAKTEEKVNVKLRKDEHDRLTENSEIEADLLLDQKDSLGVLTESQRNAVKNFYIWYTVGQYKDLAKSIKLNLAPGKLETLTELRGEEDWVFAGIEDLVITRANYGFCTLGHKLRYAYYAAPVSTSKDTSTWVVFGKDCAGDFFDISAEDMKKLVDAKNNMTDELTELVKIIENDKVEETLGRNKLMIDMVNKAVKEGVLFKVFGTVGRFAVDYINAGLPLPKSLVLELAKAFRKNERPWELILNDKATSTVEFFKNIPTQRYSTSYIPSMKWYIEYLNKFAIEGYFMYDPTVELKKLTDDIDRRLKRRSDVGGYNKNEKAIRKSILYRIAKVGGEVDDLKGVTATLALFNLYMDTGKFVLKIVKDSGYGGNAIRATQICIERIMEAGPTASEMVMLNLVRNGVSIADQDTRHELVDEPSSISVVREGYYRDPKKATEILKTYSENHDSFRPIMDRMIVEMIRIMEDIRAEQEELERRRLEDPANQLRQFIEKYPEGNGSDYFETAKAILENDVSYRGMTSRQQFVIDLELKRFRAMEAEIAEKEKVKEAEVKEVKDAEVKEAKNPLEKIAEYIAKYPEGNGSEYLKIPKAILAKGMKYGNLSEKQKTSVKKELKRFQDMEGVVAEEEEEAEVVWVSDLDAREDVRNMIMAISVAALDDDTRKRILDKTSVAIDIMRTCLKKKKVSPTQYKYLKIAYDEIKE